MHVPGRRSTGRSTVSVDAWQRPIHHVRDDLGGPLSWDIGFLVFGALLVLVGLTLSRSGETAVAATAADPVEPTGAREPTAPLRGER